ncbi:hypothetical protein EJ04DRAFT_136946 [Polyplosphaeria fusca]|uniref:Zn(2)-C6 fungal-type domain-containing protein n=1 Tax=Polyplosphaeria fusca TaxID=682080 RepID=A0A9P4QM58_9PLEO|nr:hypothetical protein EJ04DRAFT_136946 [Polyplosphaeria fusca]
MADPIDPRLQAAGYSIPPASLPPSYAPATAALQTSQAAQQQQQQQQQQHPYYLPAPTHPHSQQPPPALSQALVQALSPSNLDPALSQSSPHDQSPADHDDDDFDADHDGSHETPGSAKSPGDQKRPRACDSCRGLKVRCDQDPAQLHLPCKRCAKAHRACITTPPTRKRQKKEANRVVELERKVESLMASLQAQGSTAPRIQQPPGIPAADGSYRFGAINHDWENNANNGNGQRPPPAPPGYTPAQSYHEHEAKRRRIATIPEDMDAIHRDLAEHPEMKRTTKTRILADHSHINGLIDELFTPELAERVFQRYVTDICPHFPAVPMPPGVTAREVRDKKPLVFLAVLAGSSHGSAKPLVSEDVQRRLTNLLKDEFADIIWRKGEKSLEIVQALQLAVLWYRPPMHYEQHNFYMMVNCAAVMALDLGLGRRQTPNVMHKIAVGSFQRSHPNASSIESRRTFLVCYYLCMSITMVLRRPILLRWTKYMEESVHILETSPEALPSDRSLCQHVKMAHIGENISVQFCMDDPSVEVAISEPKVIYALKIFENELRQLREENARMEIGDPALQLAEHVTNLYVHEIALHHNQSPADFQPPFPSETFASEIGKKETIGPAHIGALGECLTATHGILDTILGIPLDVLVTLPVIFCVRAIYAIVCLMKMWVSVTTSGEVGSIIKKEHLQIESYTERLVKMFNSIVTRDKQTPHGKFYYVAKRLQERFNHIKEGSTDAADAKDEARRRAPAKTHSRQSSTNQTPLHLLSEVAMNNTPSAQSQQQAAMRQLQQQAQQPLAQQNFYPNVGYGQQAQQQNMNGIPANLDPNFDFTLFDLSTGSDADLSALFIPDGMMWDLTPDQGGMFQAF